MAEVRGTNSIILMIPTFAKKQVGSTYWADVWYFNFATTEPIFKILGALNAHWSPLSNAPKILKIGSLITKLQCETEVINIENIENVQFLLKYIVYIYKFP